MIILTKKAYGKKNEKTQQTFIVTGYDLSAYHSGVCACLFDDFFLFIF